MSIENTELVSVVIPSRNRRQRLERAIASVRSQSWPNIEIIVVDDASTDDTPAFLQALQQRDSSVRYIRNETPLGGAGARNAGIALARGRYVAFLDDDDVWLPEKLQRQIALLEKHPNASSASCAFFIDYSPTRRVFKRIGSPSDVQQILQTNHLGGASMCLTTRQALLDIGAFDASLRSGQDWDLWIKLNDLGPVVVCEEALVSYLPHDGVRITGNPRTAYAGRRRIFLRYRARMTPATRRYHMGELFYCRKVMLTSGRCRRARGVFQVVRLLGLIKGLRYVYRYLRSEYFA